MQQAGPSVWATCIALAMSASVMAEADRSNPAPRRVEIEAPGATPGSSTLLDAWLFEPGPGRGRGAAVVALHGCGGLYDRQGSISGRHRAAAERLSAMGFVVLMPDSFTTRGVREICTQTYARRAVTVDTRRRDAQAALAYLVRRTDVRPDRVALLGWSNGGSTVLATISQGSRNSVPTAHSSGFARAVAYYPGCASARRHRLRPDTPVLLLLGEKDDWTPAEDCLDWAGRTRADPGTHIEVELYSNAHHGFDSPGTNPRKRSDVPNSPNGASVTSGAHPEARRLSWLRVDDWLRPLLD